MYWVKVETEVMVEGESREEAIRVSKKIIKDTLFDKPLVDVFDFSVREEVDVIDASSLGEGDKEEVITHDRGLVVSIDKTMFPDVYGWNPTK